MKETFTKPTYNNVYTVIENLYEELCDHPEIGQHFIGVNIERLIVLQTQYVSRALGASILYTGRPIYRSHHPLKITYFQYNEVSKIFSKLFNKHGFAESDVKKVEELLLTLEKSIVTSRYDLIDLLMKPFYFVIDYFENILRSRGSLD